MSYKIVEHINIPTIVNGIVNNDRFGLFAAKTIKKVSDPYTPRDTGALMENVEFRPWEFEYIMPYSVKVWEGTNLNFQKINPFSTHHWVNAAMSVKKDNVYQTLNAALSSGRF